MRTIHSSLWVRTDEELIYTVRGDGFLHHMVRNLVGTFLQVGKGALQVEDVPRDTGGPRTQRRRPDCCRLRTLPGER